jgi:hypothetical protein
MSLWVLLMHMQNFTFNFNEGDIIVHADGVRQYLYHHLAG